MAKKLKNLNPQPFPKGDKNYIDKFYLNKDNVHHYLYHNAKGEVLFLVISKTKKTDQKVFNKVLITTEDMKSVMLGHR